MPSKVQLTGGVFQDAEGNVLANGYLMMKLSQDTSVTGVGNVCSGIEIKITLNSSGSVDTATPQYVWANDQMVPVNTFYRVTGYTAQGQPAWGPNNQQVLGSGGTFDVGLWVPNQMFYWTPAFTSVLLETNGATNVNQAVLNLKNGGGISITNDPTGTTITGSSVINLETNGTPNASQAILNLQNGTGVTVTDNGSGNISIATLTPVIDISAFIPGLQNNNQTLLRYELRQNATFPTNLSGSKCSAGVAATGSTTLTIKHNGASVGTMVFAASGTVATLTLTTFNGVVGDLIEVVAPATADITLADVAFTLVATRTS